MITHPVMTPTEAKQLLDKHNTRNRTVRPRVVEEYTRTILRGKWQDHLQNAVQIDTNGVLIDGQHRLLAIVASNKAVPLGVEYDVPPEVVDIIDRGSPRRVGDLPAIAHIKNKNLIAGVAKVLLGEDEGFALYDYTGPSRFSHQEVGDFILKNEHEIVAGTLLVSHGKMLKIQRKAMAIFAIRAMRLHTSDVLDDFLTDLGTGAGLAMGDPRLAARQWFMRYGPDQRKWEAHYSILVKSFNKWLKGETESKYFKAWDRLASNAASNFPDIDS